MGTEALWIGAALAAAGAGVNEANNRRTARKQDREIARGIRENAEKQREANKRLNEVIDRTESSSAEPYRAQRMSSLNRMAQAKRAQALASLEQTGNISDAAKGYGANAAGNAMDYAGTLSGLMSVIDAAGDQRLGEQNVKRDANMDLARLDSDINQNTFLSQLRAQRHRNNPWLSIAGAALSGAGSAYASRNP